MRQIVFKSILIVLTATFLWQQTALANPFTSFSLRATAFDERDQKPIRYKIARGRQTAGFWAMKISLEKELSISKMVEYIRTHPNDHFMPLVFIEKVYELSQPKLISLISRIKKKALSDQNYYAPLSYLYIATARQNFSRAEGNGGNILNEFNNINMETLKKYLSMTSFMFVANEDYRNIAYWINTFGQNKNYHYALPPIEAEHPPLFSVNETTSVVPVHQVSHNISAGSAANSLNTYTGLRDFPIGTMTARVTSNKPLLGHVTSSDIEVAYLADGLAFSAYVPFTFSISSVSEENNVVLTAAEEWACGKGFTAEQAADSCLGELAERVSAVGNFKNNTTVGYKTEYRLHKYSYNELSKMGRAVVDPNSFNIWAPYDYDCQIYWIEGLDAEGKVVYIPAQYTFLFTNFSEYQIFEADTTGLAAGNTLDEAKLHGILEVIERDALQRGLWSGKRSFSLESKDNKIGEILDFLKAIGLEVRFVDLTTEYGIPVYVAYLLKDGQLVCSGGYGAHLDGKIALSRALGEILVLSHHGTKLMLLNPDEEQEAENHFQYENLPNYSTGSVKGDLKKIENQLKPVYVDLTKKDINIPVVRVMIPGLELMYGRPSRKLFRKYYDIIFDDSMMGANI